MTVVSLQVVTMSDQVITVTWLRGMFINHTVACGNVNNYSFT